MPVPPTPLRTIKENPKIQPADDCPDYEVAVSRTNSNATNSTSLHWTSPVEEGPQKSHIRKVSRDLPRVEQYKYSYRLVAASTPLQFFIFVEPAPGKPAGNFTFRVALRANGLERYLCEPTVRKLKIDPRHLQFIVFVFPGKTTLPAGCLWSLRVWLRINGVDHRLFGDDELWVGKDPDFNSIGDASFARLKGVDVKEQVYHAYVGKALVTFTVRWNKCGEGAYKYALDYEAGGVGGSLFENFLMKVDGDPRTTTFLIYSVPSKSLPAGASHRIRVWVRSHVPLSSTDASTSYVLPFNDSYVYQRIWKCDSFKVGGRLDFDTLGSKMIMAFATGDPETILVTEHVKEDKPRATYGIEKHKV